MNTLFSKVRKSLALLSIGALLSTMVVVSTASAAWYDSAVERLGDASYQSMSAEARAAALSAMSSRQDAAVVLHRALGSHASSLTAAELPFSDAASIAPYALNAVASLYEGGVLLGNADGTLRPAANLNRAEVVVMLDRAGLLGSEMAEVSPAIEAEFAGVEWAFDAFRRAAADGTVQGYPDGTWRPAGPVNKAEVFVLADRANSDDFAPVEDDEEEEEEEADEEEYYDYESPLAGGAGSIEVSRKTAYLEDEVTTGETDVRVLSFEVEAKDSDVALTNLRVAFERTASTSGSTRFDRVADEVSVFQGNREVGRENVTSFTKNQNEYSRNISLSDAVVRQDDKVRFFVAVSANTVIDTANLNIDWDVEMSNIRFEDATGVVTTDSQTVTDQFKFENLASSGKVELRFRENENNPRAGVAEVSKTSSREVTLLVADMTAKGGKLEIESIPFTVTAEDDDIVTEYYLYVNGREADSVSYSGVKEHDAHGDGSHNVTFDYVEFTDLEDVLTLEADATVELKVTAKAARLPDSGAEYAPGDALTVSFTALNRDHMVINDSNYDSLDQGSRYGTVTGNAQKLYAKGVSARVAEGKNTFTENKDESGDVTRISYTVDLEVTAFGETYYIPKTVGRDAGAVTDGFRFVVEDASSDAKNVGEVVSATTVARVADAVNDGAYWRIDDGKTAIFRVTINLTNGAGDGALNEFIRARLTEVRYDVAKVNPTSGLTLTPVEDFETELRELQA